MQTFRRTLRPFVNTLTHANSTSHHSLAMVHTLRTLGSKAAAELDGDLMSDAGGWSLDQLMELAGLSVSQAIYKVHPPSSGTNILVACGPGNNGGDGLVAARHLHFYGYKPVVYYPKPTNKPIFTGLVKQLRNLKIDVRSDEESAGSFEGLAKDADLIVDALFGFSFKPPVREPFNEAIRVLEAGKKPVLAVDSPSSWDVEEGPRQDGGVGSKYMPEYLISLTAAKPSVRHFKGKRHFIGGRFLGDETAKKFGLDVMNYQGLDQVVEVPVDVKVEKL